MRTVTVATTQMACGWDKQQNIDTATELVTKAAKAGANIVLLQELFETPYFCQVITLNWRLQLPTMPLSTTLKHGPKS